MVPSHEGNISSCPYYPQLLRNFLLDQLREQSRAPLGPPTNEIIVAERDEDHFSCRMVNHALKNIEDIVEAASQDLKASIGLPYVAARAPKTDEWIFKLYDEMICFCLPLAIRWQRGAPWHHADGYSKRWRHLRQLCWRMPGTNLTV